MVGSKGKGSGEGGQKRRAHSVVLRARACVRAGNGAGTAHILQIRGVRRAAGLSPSGVSWDRVTGSRRRLTGKYVDMRGGTFLAHFSRLVSRGRLLIIHADGACTAPRGSRFQRFACGMFPWVWRRPIQQCDAFLR